MVRKLQPAYEQTDEATIVHPNTLAELVMVHSFAGAKGLPDIDGVDIHDGNVAMYMPWHGIPLDQWARCTPLPQRRSQIIPILVRVLDACLSLYEQGVIHTDIKPANILVDAHGVATLIDFNLVSLFQSPTRNPSWSSSVGTWAYAPPEIVFKARPHGRSVCWSIGMVLASVMWRHPIGFPKDKEDTTDYWEAAMRDAYKKNKAGFPLPDPLAARLDPLLRDVFCRCTRWEPDERPSIHALYDYLYKVWYLRPAPARAPAIRPCPLGVREHRRLCVGRVAGLCTAAGAPWIIPQAFALLEDVMAQPGGPLADPAHPLAMAACVYIFLLLYSVFPEASKEARAAFYELAGIHLKSPEDRERLHGMVWMVGVAVDWRLWRPSAWATMARGALHWWIENGVGASDAEAALTDATVAALVEDVPIDYPQGYNAAELTSLIRRRLFQEL